MNAIYVLLWVAGIICVGATVFGLVIGNKQKGIFDVKPTEGEVKHKVLRNPIILSYIFFPLAVAIGGALLYLYLGDSWTPRP